MKVQDFTTEKYSEAQRQNAAAILILLPQNISSIPHDAVQVVNYSILKAFVQYLDENRNFRKIL